MSENASIDYPDRHRLSGTGHGWGTFTDLINMRNAALTMVAEIFDDLITQDE